MSYFERYKEFHRGGGPLTWGFLGKKRVNKKRFWNKKNSRRFTKYRGVMPSWRSKITRNWRGKKVQFSKRNLSRASVKVFYYLNGFFYANKIRHRGKGLRLKKKLVIRRNRKKSWRHGSKEELGSPCLFKDSRNNNKSLFKSRLFSGSGPEKLYSKKGVIIKSRHNTLRARVRKNGKLRSKKIVGRRASRDKTFCIKLKKKEK